MGIYLFYNEHKQKWCYKGFMFEWYFDTEEEAKANREKVWQHHMDKLNAWNMICNTLVAYR